MGALWAVVVASDDFERFMRKLPEYEQAVVVAAIEHVLAAEGIGICDSEWGRAIGSGLYEFRIRRPLDTILRSAGIAHAGRSKPVLLRVLRVRWRQGGVAVWGLRQRSRPEREATAARDCQGACGTSPLEARFEELTRICA